MMDQGRVAHDALRGRRQIEVVGRPEEGGSEEHDVGESPQADGLYAYAMMSPWRVRVASRAEEGVTGP